ncbi:MAG: 50S ribosomal protein L3 [Anaerolineae bacterium]
MKGILGKKVGMTQIFDDSGEVIPVTVIEAGPCYITQVKTDDTDGYNAVQIGFEQVEARKLNKPERGHLGQLPLLRYLREIRTDDAGEYEVGQQVDVDIFAAGQRVDVTGISKGRGFAGVVKRHGFHGGPKTHGQSDRHRAPGSIGAGSTPGRVFKGMRMAGRMGNERVTIQSLKVVDVDPDRNLLLVEGSVPGRRGGLILIRDAVKS